MPFRFIPTTKHHKNQIQEPPFVASNPIVPGLSSEPARKIGRSIYQSKERSLVALMERMSSSVQSWVEDHKLATIGGVSAAAVGAAVAYSRRTPQRATSLRLIHAQALTLAALGGAALMHYYSKSSASKRRDDLDYDFYSQLPAATDADGKENERWSW